MAYTAVLGELLRQWGMLIAPICPRPRWGRLDGARIPKQQYRPIRADGTLVVLGRDDFVCRNRRPYSGMSIVSDASNVAAS